MAAVTLVGPAADVPPGVEELGQLLLHLWTTNLAKAHQMSRALRSGSVWVNTYGNFDPAVPFGGYKASSWGARVRGGVAERTT